MTDQAARTQQLFADISELLARGDEQAVRPYLDNLHPSDLADLIEEFEGEQRIRFVSLLPPAVASAALAEMDEEEKPEELLVQLAPEQVREIVEELPDDDAADLLGDLEPEQREKVLESVEDSTEIEELLHYPEDTAGGIMTRELVAVSIDLTAGEAIEEIRRVYEEGTDFYSVFVVDAQRRLRGMVSVQDLALAEPSRPLVELTEDPPAVVPVDMDQEEVGRILARYNLASIGVVGPLGRLVGRITFDDVIDVLEAETTEDILRFAAVSEEELLRGGTAAAIRSRLPWMLVNLLTAMLAASVVFLFRSTIERLALLAVVMPVIAGMGGNAGTQALAVTVRRIALSDETLRSLWTVLGKELAVGLINGFVLGAVAAGAGYLLAGRVEFGLVVLLAMWGNLLVAGFAGAFIPIFLESIGVDPAVASSVFVTTLTDLFGFFLLLGLATLVLL